VNPAASHNSNPLSSRLRLLGLAVYCLHKTNKDQIRPTAEHGRFLIARQPLFRLAGDSLPADNSA
jgi:hypothetical protein